MMRNDAWNLPKNCPGLRMLALQQSKEIPINLFGNGFYFNGGKGVWISFRTQVHLSPTKDRGIFSGGWLPSEFRWLDGFTKHGQHLMWCNPPCQAIAPCQPTKAGLDSIPSYIGLESSRAAVVARLLTATASDCFWIDRFLHQSLYLDVQLGLHLGNI